MGSLGWQEMTFIFFLALVIFGPKKLPELGRTVGKALSEFRRASSELKSTFDREMRNLEQETESINQSITPYQSESYNYDYSQHEANYEGAYSHEGSYGSEYHDSGTEHHDSTASHTPTVSASAPQDAESHATGPDGTVAQGSIPANGTPAVDPHHASDPHSPAPMAPHSA